MKKPRSTKILRRTYSIAYLDQVAGQIAQEREQERRTGRNVEEREEWRATWDELYHKKRGL